METDPYMKQFSFFFNHKSITMKIIKWKNALWILLILTSFFSCSKDDNGFNSLTNVPGITDTIDPGTGDSNGGSDDNDDEDDNSDENDSDEDDGTDGDDGSDEDDIFDETGSNTSDFVPLSRYAIVGDNLQLKKDYKVDSKYKSEQNDKDTHKKMWSYFKKLIPVNKRTAITEFVVFNGGESLSGYVELLKEDLSQWEMGLAIDLYEDTTTPDLNSEFAYVCLHEFAHVLTLNSTQVAPTIYESYCETYHTGDGCSNQSSYINNNYQIGWADIWAEYIEIKEEVAAKYPDRFITLYAATNPDEDIAEVFTNFVINNKPTGQTISDKKILKLWENSGLKSIREEIRRNSLTQNNITSRARHKIKCSHKHHQ